MRTVRPTAATLRQAPVIPRPTTIVLQHRARRTRTTPPETRPGAPESRAETDPRSAKNPAEKRRRRQKAPSRAETTTAAPAARTETRPGAAEAAAETAA